MRRGDVVLRPAEPWSRNLVALLQHLEREGFAGSPRPVGAGFATDGREALRFVEGAVHPEPWTDEGVHAVGVLLRRFHDASRGFVPAPGAAWRPWFGRRLGGGPRLVGHCDTGPWNVVARDDLPVAFIDWEVAGPVDPLVDLAQTAWLNAQLFGDVVADRVGLGDVHTRARQLRLLVEGYGLPRTGRATLLDLVVEVATLDAARQPEEVGVSAATTAWAVEWRTASVEWMVRHRGELTNALTG